MIDRLRPKPLPLAKLELLIPRTPSYFKCLPDMQRDLAKRRAGYSGEKKVDTQLQHLSHQYSILHDVHLRAASGNSFQIDTLILTPYAIFIIESKHYRRTITFDTILHQLVHDDGDSERGYRYPIIQVEKQKFFLENWLQHHTFANIPIYYMIAIADPGTIIHVEGDKQFIANVVMHGEQVPKRIHEINAIHSKQNSTHIPVKQIRNAILRECSDFDKNVLDQYNITSDMILPGVICPNCGRLGMKRNYGNWDCPKCQSRSRNAHQEALNAYLLLIKNRMTNSECMQFLKITSRHQALRILRSANLIYSVKDRYWRKK